MPLHVVLCPWAAAVEPTPSHATAAGSARPRYYHVVQSKPEVHKIVTGSLLEVWAVLYFSCSVPAVAQTTQYQQLVTRAVWCILVRWVFNA